MRNSMDDLELMYSFFREGEATEADVMQQFDITSKQLEEIEFKNMLSGKEDILSCVVQINAGAGGTESCDWAAMLRRMYLMWGEKHGYTVKETDRTEGDVAGIKSVTLEFEGDYAFGYLKGENGVHRLVRISPFDSNAVRHNSDLRPFAPPAIGAELGANMAGTTFRPRSLLALVVLAALIGCAGRPAPRAARIPVLSRRGRAAARAG